jgi:SAM-dependent methyltransferase
VIDPPGGAAIRLLCPICGSEVKVDDSSGLCQSNGHRFSRAGGIWRFLPLAREVQHRAFMSEYRTVRRAEKWGGSTPDYYRALPRVRRGDPHSNIWRVRERNFRHLLSWMGTSAHLRILDVGAGNGWLSNRLRQRGHTVAALDLSDDLEDGLGAVVNYEMSFECYQAEFDRLPFCPAQFDLLIFNAALHYSRGLVATLCEARKVLAAGGKIAALDSPFYSSEACGLAMVEAREADFAQKFGFRREVAETGFFTFESVRAAAGAAGLQFQSFDTDGAWPERLRRMWTMRRTGREPARFPLVVFQV